LKTIRFNGNDINDVIHENLYDFIKDRDIKVKNYIIEYNGRIILIEEYASIKIKNGDNIEILYFAGGG
jgi:thiamine biosynthesis protein ThiS